MKILQVYPYFYPAWSYGGVTRAVYEIAKKLSNREHEITVYTTDALDSSSRIVIKSVPTYIEGMKVYYFRNISNYLAYKHKISFPPYMPLKIRKKVKKLDIIHLHGYRHSLNVMVYYYAKKFDVPYILQAHGSIPRARQKQNLKKLYDWIWGYKILRDASKVIALNKTEAEQYKNMGVDEDKIEIVPNGIDLSEYANLPERGEFKKKYSIEENKKIVMYLGRIHKIKGIDLLVKAFSDVAEKINGVMLVIVGPDDGFLSPLKQKIENLKIGGNVLFTGPLYENDKLGAYVDADIYVLPSIYETFPNTVLEACACGTPVIVTNRCGVANIVKKIGCVVEYDKDQLHNALFKMLSDAELRKKLAKKSRELVREFGWDNIVEKIESIYEGVILT